MLSAKDLAIISQHLIRDFPEVLEVTKQATAVFDKGGASEQVMATYNYMLMGLPAAVVVWMAWRPERPSLPVPVSSARRIQITFRIITVVLNADNAETDEYARLRRPVV